MVVCRVALRAKLNLRAPDPVLLSGHQSYHSHTPQPPSTRNRPEREEQGRGTIGYMSNIRFIMVKCVRLIKKRQIYILQSSDRTFGAMPDLAAALRRGHPVPWAAGWARRAG